MILYFARHGETELNVGDRYQGTTDLRLNTHGRAQAHALASRLPTEIRQVVASPQRRAIETAQAVSSKRGLRLMAMAEFRERDFGIFEGLSPSEIQAGFPDLWAIGIMEQWAAAPPGGETTSDVVQCVAVGLLTLRDLFPSQAVLLVAHGFVGRAVRYLLTETRRENFFVMPKVGNAEFVTYFLS